MKQQQRKAAGYDFDVVVLGGGSAGYAAARTTVAAGLRTAVVDGARKLGGLCILRGCMPTKALLQSSDVLHLAQRASEFGVQTGRVRFDFARVQARKAALIADFAGYRRGQLNDGRFELIGSNGRFSDAHTLELTNGRLLTAAHFVVATGSQVAVPPVPGLVETGFLTSDDALELASPPKSLIVLGGGAVALEFAQFFARFGTRVTVVQRSPQLLRGTDADVAQAVEVALVQEGLRVFTGTRLVGVRRRGRTKEVQFEHAGQLRRVAADEILCALGRAPNTETLRLDRAGVTTDRGRILTDEAMRSVEPHIYAGGDCTSPHEIVHLAVLQGEIAGHNIVFPDGPPRRLDYRLLIQVVFTEPAVAVVGSTELEAKERGVDCLVATYPFGDHGKSLILGATAGFVKLLAAPGSGEILGGACVGPQGGELIHEIVVAMAKRMTVAELAAVPHYHPTLAEIWTYPAEELAGRVTP